MTPASASTERLEPGESGTVSAEWPLPQGVSPGQLAVTSVDDGDETARTQRTVELENVPVGR